MCVVGGRGYDALRFKKGFGGSLLFEGGEVRRWKKKRMKLRAALFTHLGKDVLAGSGADVADVQGAALGQLEYCRHVLVE